MGDMMTQNDETVTISYGEYQRLQERSRKLDALENAGVDNWEWYDDAMASVKAEN